MPVVDGVGCSMEALKGCSSPLPNRYEEEINKRTTAENDFVLLKKVRHQQQRRDTLFKGKTHLNANNPFYPAVPSWAKHLANV